MYEGFIFPRHNTFTQIHTHIYIWDKYLTEWKKNKMWKPTCWWRSHCPYAQDKIITAHTGSAAQLASSWQTKMSMSGPVYMHASIATAGLVANQYLRNGLDHLCTVERPDTHIIFPSSCSSQIHLDAWFDSCDQHLSASTKCVYIIIIAREWFVNSFKSGYFVNLSNTFREVLKL